MQGSGERGILGKERTLIRRFDLEIAAISLYLDRLHRSWAQTLGISGPQFRIIAALADTDQGAGMPVMAVSKVLHVAPSFVTTQSKLLEKRGLIRRETSLEDARIVIMSLTAATRKHLADLASQQEFVDDFIFSGFGSGEFEALTGKLALLKRKLERACLNALA
jgi:MarR family transcriptional regulator, organic hydroperoxide resistance regulator